MTKTAAERQKRYRAKKRNVPTPTGESVSFDPHGVTQTVTESPESVTRVTDIPTVTHVMKRDIPSVTGPASIRAMSDTDLQFKLNSYPGASWVNSPEHCEVLRRRQCMNRQE